MSVGQESWQIYEDIFPKDSWLPTSMLTSQSTKLLFVGVYIKVTQTPIFFLNLTYRVVFACPSDSSHVDALRRNGWCSPHPPHDRVVDGAPARPAISSRPEIFTRCFLNDVEG